MLDTAVGPVRVTVEEPRKVSVFADARVNRIDYRIMVQLSPSALDQRWLTHYSHIYRTDTHSDPTRNAYRRITNAIEEAVSEWASEQDRSSEFAAAHRAQLAAVVEARQAEAERARAAFNDALEAVKEAQAELAAAHRQQT